MDAAAADLDGGCTAAPPRVLDGDPIFHTSRSSQSVAIQKATHSKYSHMGVIFPRGGRPYVFEAVSTVKYTPLADWIKRGNRRKYVVKRLRDSSGLLTDQQVEELRAQARRLQGKPYDLTFEWSDQQMYCSELVWKMYDRALASRSGSCRKSRISISRILPCAPGCGNDTDRICPKGKP